MSNPVSKRDQGWSGMQRTATSGRTMLEQGVWVWVVACSIFMTPIEL